MKKIIKITDLTRSDIQKLKEILYTWHDEVTYKFEREVLIFTWGNRGSSHVSIYNDDIIIEQLDSINVSAVYKWYQEILKRS
jgi:hypothetical protein